MLDSYTLALQVVAKNVMKLRVLPQGWRKNLTLLLLVKACLDVQESLSSEKVVIISFCIVLNEPKLTC